MQSLHPLFCSYWLKLSAWLCWLGCGSLSWGNWGLDGRGGRLIGVGTKSVAMRTANEALVKPFEQPVRVFLRDRSVIHSLLNAVAHLGSMGSLDRRLHICKVHTGFLRHLLECL